MSLSRQHYLPLPYRVFFLLLEPISALVGAYYAHFRQLDYLALLDAPATAPMPTPASALAPATSVAMSQLANMYLFFAINEALVLRSTPDTRVWRTVLLVLLIADLGHLYSMKDLGLHVFYDVGSWNASGWGNVAWVYVGAAMRICFLAGVGIKQAKGSKQA